MFVLCCRCFFLPVLYEHSFNLIKQKQKATKVKIPLTVCTYYNVMPVGFSDTKETLELKSNNKRKREENCILPSFIRYTFLPVKAAGIHQDINVVESWGGLCRLSYLH